MQSAHPRQAGRPTSDAKPGEKTTLSLRVTPTLKRRLDEQGKEEGRNLSQEAERRLEATFQEQDALDRAMALAFGPDNAGFVLLAGEIFKALVPRGEWLVDADAGALAARGLVHALRRLQAPDDGFIDDDTPEGRVDGVLYNLGLADGSGYARWAAAKRERFGVEIGSRLVKRHQVVKASLEQQPQREMPKPDPATAASWERAIATAQRPREEDA